MVSQDTPENQLLVDLRNAFWGSTSCEHLLLPSTLRRSYGVRLILGEKSDISGDIIFNILHTMYAKVSCLDSGLTPSGVRTSTPLLPIPSTEERGRQRAGTTPPGHCKRW